jgi:hypothetical protein
MCTCCASLYSGLCCDTVQGGLCAAHAAVAWTVTRGSFTAAACVSGCLPTRGCTKGILFGRISCLCWALALPIGSWSRVEKIGKTLSGGLTKLVVRLGVQCSRLRMHSFQLQLLPSCRSCCVRMLASFTHQRMLSALRQLLQGASAPLQAGQMYTGSWMSHMKHNRCWHDVTLDVLPGWTPSRY